MNVSFGRIQFTPDTLPSDVVGVSVFNSKSSEFEFKEGVIMNQITVDGIMQSLPTPFMVVATQNPVEYLGTYPLPEAQMDRFMMRLSIGYPTPEEEIHLMKNYCFCSIKMCVR